MSAGLVGPDGDIIRFGADGLIPVTLQDVVSRRVLMVGFMNSAALDATRQTGLVHFWSRSRHKLWQKGETSGNVSRVRDIRINCEQNSLLILVEQTGAICHDGYPTCYYRSLGDDGQLMVMEPRAFDPEMVYGADLERRPDNASAIATWFGAYEYLRDHDLAAESSTSRRLRGDDDLAQRIVDELGELAGVIDGSHRHDGLEEDLALEGGQVLYWIVLLAIRGRHTVRDFGMAETVGLAGTSTGEGLDGEGEILRALACRWSAVGASPPVTLFRLTIAAIVRICGLRGIDAVELVRTDLASLFQRPYLTSYFDNLGRTGG